MQSTPTRQTPPMFYLRMLLCMFVYLLIRLVALAPLCALFVWRGTWAAWLCLLTPVLYVFLVMPLRYSFAEAMVQPSRQRFFSFDAALSLERYWDKLMEGLWHFVSVLKWGIPTFALLGYAYYCYSSQQLDGFTLLNNITALGTWVSNVYCNVGNLFLGLFGGAKLTPSALPMAEGIYTILGIFGLALLIWVYGAVRNSASRFIWVLAGREDRVVRTEVRRRLLGRRWRQLGVALVNLVFLLPFLVPVVLSLKGMLGDLSTLMMMRMPTLDMASVLMPLVAYFLLLYMTLLPARRWNTAAFAVRKRRHSAPAKTDDAKA